MAAKPRKRGKAAPEERRQAILDAGLLVFAADGFASAKLEDVAVKANIAKGTIYLYFRDKEDLLEQIIRNAATLVLSQLQNFSTLPDISTTTLMEKIFEIFQTQILATDRKLIIKLLLSEGIRFPKIAEYYYNDVIRHGLELIRKIAQRAIARGENFPPEIETFPHLMFAPMMMALIWDAYFAPFDSLDINEFLLAHKRILTAPGLQLRTRKQ